MSATGRGTVRNEADFYPTPAWCVHRLLERLLLPGGEWLEPAAGEGAIIRAVNEHLLLDNPAGPPQPTPSDIHWTAVELRHETRFALRALIDPPEAHTGINFLRGDFVPARWSVAITNPPFSFAEEFVRAMLECADWAILLLRLNFLGSAKRRALFANEMPDIYVLPNRPSFTGKGTDATEYCWMVWTPERGRTSGRIEILAETPAEQRRAA